MDDPDPFADPAFSTRVQKLLAMLASEQPGEADAARRKLMEHLGHHRLSLNDLAQRVGMPPAARGAAASFTQGASELSRARQLTIARDARREAEQEVAELRGVLDRLQVSLQDATFDVGRALQGRAQMRARASLAWGVAAVCLLVAAVPPLVRLVPRGGGDTAAPVALRAPEGDASRVLRIAPGERVGTVLVQDLAIRLTPYENAGVRAFLNQGMRVAVQQQLQVGPESWLLIRSITGSGWVRASDVLH